MDASDGEHSEWPMRPWLLSGGLALAGLLVWLASDTAEDVPWRMAATAFVFFGSIAAAFTVERERWKEPLAFALLAGFVMAGLAWRAVAAGDRYADEEYGFAAGVIATALALPLFQAGFHRTRAATPYERVHYNVWSDAISAAGSLAFVGAAWLLLVLLSELFHLLKIDVLRDLMNEEWFGWTYSGAAFGSALGTLRNQLKIVGTLQQVGTVVLSILAVPLALGLALFLVAMIVSGPEVLWDATRSATPILLACAAGAWVLANAILRETDVAMSGNRVLRWAAFALALSILPLTAFAAISLGTRVDQHGLSPERIWGLIAIAVACVYGVAWLVALVRGWKPGDWRERLRRANLHLAALVCLIAFVLALPILNFGAISTRNQVARLESGAVPVDEFDFNALRWDFGDAGRVALRRLAISEQETVAELAQAALDRTDRPYLGIRPNMPFRDRLANIRGSIDDAQLMDALRTMVLNEPARCQQVCTAFDVGINDVGKPHLVLVEGKGLTHYQLETDGRLRMYFPEMDASLEEIVGDSEAPGGSAEPDVEIRSIEARQVYVNGEPIGQPFE